MLASYFFVGGDAFELLSTFPLLLLHRRQYLRNAASSACFGAFLPRCQPFPSFRYTFFYFLSNTAGRTRENAIERHRNAVLTTPPSPTVSARACSPSSTPLPPSNPNPTYFSNSILLTVTLQRPILRSPHQRTCLDGVSSSAHFVNRSIRKLNFLFSFFFFQIFPIFPASFASQNRNPFPCLANPPSQCLFLNCLLFIFTFIFINPQPSTIVHNAPLRLSAFCHFHFHSHSHFHFHSHLQSLGAQRQGACPTTIPLVPSFSHYRP